MHQAGPTSAESDRTRAHLPVCLVEIYTRSKRGMVCISAWTFWEGGYVGTPPVLGAPDRGEILTFST